jgi:glutamate synthase (ferredoxin)
LLILRSPKPLIKTLHTAIRTHKPDLYKLYEEAVQSRPPTTLRDLLKFVPIEKSGRDPVSIDEVESVESIMNRFCSGELFNSIR